MSNEIIDTHVHFGAPKDEESGCYWSDEFTKQPAYFAMLLLTKSLFKKVDIHSVKKHMFKVINGSKSTTRAVTHSRSKLISTSPTNLSQTWQRKTIAYYSVLPFIHTGSTGISPWNIALSGKLCSTSGFLPRK